ncbi:hypothetical protein EYF80_020490 [Liparis tanakae]|uniref:Uncharacterized protein n=1 Tax=Liparis tanakae TaxID=230148 RepID=A0A4Z2HU50_9TELE|nr:hypothetical protein EYF80_020490 [Liparis tanakae]
MLQFVQPCCALPPVEGAVSNDGASVHTVVLLRGEAGPLTRTWMEHQSLRERDEIRGKRVVTERLKMKWVKTQDNAVF